MLYLQTGGSSIDTRQWVYEAQGKIDALAMAVILAILLCLRSLHQKSRLLYS